MTRFIGCETARDMLDSLLDDELPVDDQVMVETHLRWCRTCASRVEDMRAIGAMIREGSPAQQAAEADAQAIAAIPAGVLLRIRTERELALGVRLREMFSDMRLFWPALGATTALAVCITGALLVLHWSSEQQPESLAAMISTLEPGSEGNPLRPDNGVRSLDEALQQYVDENRLSAGISIPRAINDGALFEGLGDGDDVLLSTVVSRDGRIADYQILSGQSGQRTSRGPAHVDAVLADAVRLSRFAPAQTPGGSKVAVTMVWLITSTPPVRPAVTAAVRTRVVEVREVLPPLVPEPSVVPAVAPEVGRDLSSSTSATA